MRQKSFPVSGRIYRRTGVERLRERAFYERVKGRTKCQEKIAVITARADDHTQKDIICGIAEAAFAADTDVVVFSNIYNHRIRDEFLNFENVIYDFFDPSGFDGVIVTAEAFLDISIITLGT